MAPQDPIAGDPSSYATPVASPLPSGLASALADRYRVERELGAGGMATVYLAEDVRHHRKVALKVVRPELSASLGSERFLREIALTASLQHPHILPLFDSGEADGLLYYVMPFVEGETLRARLEREQQLPVADALRIAGEIADALQYAHARGVVHRDVKPENILLDRATGRPMLADFGIALALQQAGGQRITQTGLSLGTPQYMAPEQAMGERTIDARTDVYALGTVLYEMLAGEPPFTGPSAQAVVARVMTEEPRPLTVLRRSVPVHVDAAVRRALEKLPADRFTSAGDFSSALRAAATAPASPAPGAARGPLVGWRQHRLTLGIVAVAVVALVAAWGWTMASRGTGAVDPAAGAGNGQAAWLATLAFPDSALPEGSFTLSPDGARLVYAARGPGGGPQLWVREAGTLEPRALPGTTGALFPAVSPDGQRVAFLAGSALRVATLSGGTVTTLADSLGAAVPIEWGGDDHLLVSSRTGIVRISARSDARPRVTTVDSTANEVFHLHPSPLPGGDAVLFTVAPKSYGDLAGYRIAVSDAATGRHRPLIAGVWARYAPPGHLLVVRADSALVAVPFDATTHRVTGDPVVLAAGVTIEGYMAQFAVAGSGQLVYATGGGAPRLSLARVRPDGTPAIVDSSWAVDATDVAVSRDATHAAVVVQLGSVDVQVHDLRTGATSRLSAPGTLAHDPVFTDDGRKVIFVGDGPSGGRLFEAVLGSAAPPRLLLHDPDVNFYEPTPSADGRTLYYLRRRGDGSDIHARPLDGSAVPDRAVVATPALELSPRPSPDGRWLAYRSNESGRFQVYVRSTDPSRAERWQVSVARGTTPRWSHDSRTLYYLVRDSLMAADVAAGDAFSVQRRRALFSTARFDTQNAGFDVLPGTEGFLMLQRRDDLARRRQIVFVDRWTALLAAARTRR